MGHHYGLWGFRFGVIFGQFLSFCFASPPQPSAQSTERAQSLSHVDLCCLLAAPSTVSRTFCVYYHDEGHRLWIHMARVQSPAVPIGAEFSGASYSISLSFDILINKLIMLSFLPHKVDERIHGRDAGGVICSCLVLFTLWPCEVRVITPTTVVYPCLRSPDK